MGKLKPPIRFFTQHNRFGQIFRADPCYCKESKEPWYDWAFIDWGQDDVNCVPAKLLIFMEIEANQISEPFKFGEAYITEPGAYALTYSFRSNKQQQAHQDSLLVEYGEIELTKQVNGLFQPIIYPVNVDSIVASCIVVPYNTSDDSIIATEWLLLKARDKWYDIFLDFMNKEI
jgi:hypothetical protein